ncbi:conserved Plasmodium protein, unknown function [Plasmodium yoelii]|uniref:Uncharacterized protein n=2 Tax=Plasmodium yoelii TaxID=5861 RepID=A0AAE9WTW1_PLAYO|nr:conserved Plasmodium protein, unknown function [Plasmodium yoelii]WBY60026.1 hypothetical protein Py17XNL_001303195 [Plasmodium yoelii yoelii]CDU19957.1 conserved Plasmodium protein, unknown function [Plasmodium yoelii]VTZ80715.1 conserved Plasmodium protein, unknown function [Plasmodium yoelii]|eukprot:XP_022813611.1 conserved Plasmodium protein, unknown function [Plasmodium yoelii]
MIRKRKSNIEENGDIEANIEAELMEGGILFGQRSSSINKINESLNKNIENDKKEINKIKKKNENKLNPFFSAISLNSNKNNNIINNDEPINWDKLEKCESIEHIHGRRSKNKKRVHILDSDKKKEKRRSSIDELCNKYDKEVKDLLQNFEFMSFSQLFKNPFDPNMNRDEKIVRIFYYSGFTFLPYIGWVIASIYGSFSKGKNNKNIISLRIISSIQTVVLGLIIITILVLINMSNNNMMQCELNGISFKKKLVKEGGYNIVFFGPRSTNDWMESKLAQISEDLEFNVYSINYPNTKNRIIPEKNQTFLKTALECASIKHSHTILFSFQLESALKYTIPFLETNEILGFFSFLKRYPKNKSTINKRGNENIIYFSPLEQSLYDIYTSLTFRKCQNEQNEYYNTFHIVHNSFNKYRIRCSKNLARDYSIIANNFKFSTIGVDKKESKYEEEDFKEAVDGFYQYLLLIRSILSEDDLEHYRNILCKSNLCEEKGSVCVI